MFKFKKASWRRGVACLLVLFSLLTVWAFAENAVETETAAAGYMPAEVVTPEEIEAGVEVASAASADPEVNVLMGLKNIAASTGVMQSIENGDCVDIACGCHGVVVVTFTAAVHLEYDGRRLCQRRFEVLGDGDQLCALFDAYVDNWQQLGSLTAAGYHYHTSREGT